MLLRDNNRQAGLTLIELLVVITIVIIMTGVVMANLPAFRSKTELDLIAQEVAITIRQAQVYGVNAKSTGASGTFTPYGVNFTVKPGQEKSFILFADLNDNKILDGTNCGGTNECRERYDFRGGIKVVDIQTQGGCSPLGAGTCPVFDVGSSNSLNTSFKQPNLEAIFSSSGTQTGQLFTRNVRITIGKEPIADPANLRDIFVYTTGFIYVNKR